LDWNGIGEEKRYTFIGAYLAEIELILFPRNIMKAGHVVVLPIYQGQFLFTVHKERGIEWPGGKVENGETELHGALRELEEETGGQAGTIGLLGQYIVYGKEQPPFVKNIYIADVYSIRPEQVSGCDTFGHILVPYSVQPLVEKGYSPLVSDPVFSLVRDIVVSKMHRC
jgi:8-oxo-dGTP diphosphatase